MTKPTKYLSAFTANVTCKMSFLINEAILFKWSLGEGGERKFRSLFLSYRFQPEIYKRPMRKFYRNHRHTHKTTRQQQLQSILGLEHEGP